MRVVLRLIVAGWLLAMPAVTLSRVWLWQDEAALWRESTRVAPERARGWNVLGAMHHRRGDRQAAALYYTQAVHSARNVHRPARERAADWMVGTTNLAVLAYESGDLEDAEGLARAVFHRHPGFQPAQDVLIAVRMAQGVF